jgi:flagellar biosynthesis regulator FlaF
MWWRFYFLIWLYMIWEDYEHYIYKYFQNLYPEENISKNVKKIGFISKIERQIDILIEGKIAGYDLSLAVECKHFNKKVDVKIVEAFISFLKDVKANKGILITNKGFTKGAKSRAENDSTSDIDLRIIEFDKLEEFQGFGGIAYSNSDGFFFAAPKGWITDLMMRFPTNLATLYPVGLTFEESLKVPEYMYIYITNKTENHYTLQSLLDYQEIYMKERGEACDIEYTQKNIRNDAVSILRTAKYTESKVVDSTLFVDFPDAIFYCSLITDIKSTKNNLKHLEKLMSEAIPIKVNHSDLSTSLEKL